MAMSPRKMMAMSKDMAKAAKMMMGGEAKVKKLNKKHKLSQHLIQSIVWVLI